MRFEFDPMAERTNEHLRSLGIRAGLFDFDDTLVYTNEIFARFLMEYVEAVAVDSGLDREELSMVLMRINDEERSKMGGVSPARWETVVARLAAVYPEHDRVIGGYLPTLLKIYRTEPRLKPGAKQVLAGLLAGGFCTGVVTHANHGWAEWKAWVTGLDNYIQLLMVADENGHKRSEHWEKAATELGLEPSECLAIGDNLEGDVEMAISLGMRAIFIPSPRSGKGKVPPGVVTIKDLDGFWDGVMKLK